MAEIEWKDPWHPEPLRDGVPLAQAQLEKEISPAHPLYGRGARVVGRRQDCDDLVVVLGDGSFVNVHLTWSQGKEQFPSQYPSWHTYGTLEDFILAMNEDAAEFGQ